MNTFDAWNEMEKERKQRKQNAPCSKWISVKERLPDNGQYVLAYSEDDDFMTVEARHKFDAFQITHWMPLPEPPEKGGGEE